MAELADAADSKSAGREALWVRFPPPVPYFMLDALVLALCLSMPASAQGAKCRLGNEPRLSGDFFAPVECSTAALKVESLPLPPVEADKRASLKELAGRWEGAAVAGFGRYELLLTLEKPSWTGSTRATAKLKELQFRERQGHVIELSSRGRNRWALELKSEALPGRALEGKATLGADEKTGERRFDAVFDNGARHVALLRLEGEELKVRLWSAVPGAPPRELETVLRRSTRESL